MLQKSFLGAGFVAQWVKPQPARTAFHIGVPVRVLAALFPNQFPDNVPGEAA